MRAVQVKVRDLENKLTSWGVMYKNGDVICLDDGWIFPVEERGITHEVEAFTTWIEISEEFLKRHK